jgi:hypothetical protein
VLLAEGYGRDLIRLAAFEAVDLPGALRALTEVADRPPSLRPVRRLEILTWDGTPVRDSEAAAAFATAGFAGDGARFWWEGRPSPR